MKLLTPFLSRSRPSYPSDALKFIRQEVAASGSLDIVEYEPLYPRGGGDDKLSAGLVPAPEY